MRHTDTGCGTVVGVALATLWLGIVFTLTRLGIGPVLEDGSGTVYWDGKPVSSYCLPLAICD